MLIPDVAQQLWPGPLI